MSDPCDAWMEMKKRAGIIARSADFSQSPAMSA
jgi:hypothetical protein